MKILVANMIYYKEHIPFDENIIEDLNELGNVTVMTPKIKWYADIGKVIFQGGMHLLKSKKKTSFYKVAYKNVQMICQYSVQNNIDILVLTEYEVILLPYLIKRLRNSCKIAIVHHNNIDIILNSELKRKTFDRCKKNVSHLVLEPFIVDVLSEKLNVDKRKIYCVPHPLPNINKSYNLCKYSLVGLSQSNDEAIISEIIEREKKDGFAKKNNLKIILKSKVYSYDDGSLQVINGWIDENLYRDYIGNAACILIPFPDSFKYRVSATIMEAVMYRIPYIASSIPLTEYYFAKYPRIGKRLNVSKLEYDLKEYINASFSGESDFVSFIDAHSKQIRIKSLRELVCDENKNQ